MRKALYAVAATIAVLLLLIVTLLFSHSGNVFLWNQVSQRIDALSGELVEGQLLSGWTLENLRWEDSAIRFSSRKIILRWQLSKIIDRQLPISLIDISQSSLILNPTESDPAAKEKPPQPNQPLDIPLDIRIDQIRLQTFSFESPAASVTVGELSTDAALVSNQLSLNKTRIDQLNIVIPVTEMAQSSNTTSQPDSSPITLPEVELPLPIQLNDLQVTNISYQQGAIHQGAVQEKISKLSLAFDWQQTQINKLQMIVDHPMASASLSGEIDLSGNYPLKAVLNAQIHQPLLDGMLEGEQLLLETSGSLDNLQLSLNAKGPATAQLKGTLQPITPDLPFDLNLNWQQVNWPLAGEPKLVSTQNGQLSVAGNLKGYSIKLNSDVEMPGQPLTRVALQGKGDLGQLSIEQLLLKEPEGHLVLNGDLSWKDGIYWQGKTTLVNLNPGLWVPTLPGKLNGSIDSDFQFVNNQWQVDIPVLNIKGNLRQYPVNISGKLSAKQASGIIPVAANIDKLSAAIGQNTLTANGKLADKWSMKATLDARDLSELYPELQGSTKGDFLISGTAKAPAVKYQLQSPQILFQQFNLTGLQAEGTITSADTIAGQTSITLDELLTGELSLSNIDLQASGNEQQHKLSLKADGKPVSGQIDLKGSWKNQQWQGVLNSAAFQTPLDEWALESPLSIGVNKQQQVRLSNQCWLSLDTRFCIDNTTVSADNGSARFQLANFNFERLSFFFPDNLKWQSILSAKGQVQWQGKEPTASLQLKTTPGTLSAGELSFDYNRLELLLNFQQQRLSSSLQFQSDQLGVANIEVAVDDVQKQRNLSGNAAIDKLRLDFLTPFVPEVSTIDGNLSAKVRLGGSLEKPLLFGDLALEQGLLYTKTQMVSITDLTTRLKINGDNGIIDGHMNIGEGRLNIGGDLNWQQMPPSGKITLKGDNIQFQYPGLLQVKVSPDLNFSLGKSMALTGKVTIPWARIEVEALPKSAVKVSDDVIIINNGEPEQSDTAAPFNMNVEIVLGDDITLDAYGLKTNLEGRLRLVQETGKSLAGNGSIQLKEGRYRYLGQDLLIQEGDIIFSGPLSNPYLVIDAIRNPDTVVDDTRVGIKVNGTIKTPDWEVYSEPAMSQSEQLSYLLRGRGLDNGDDSALQSILLNVGVSQFGGVVSTVGEAIGFSDVTLDTEGSGSDTQVTVGGNIAPGLRLSYGAGVFSSISEIKVRYELMPRLYLQAVSGLAQAVDLFYQFKIDNKRKVPASGS